MQPPPQGLVCVLGMHRSGTSAVTRALPVLGVALGDTLMPAVAGDNDTGYWEDRDLNRINIDCLAALDSDWDDLRLIEPARQLDRGLAQLQQRAVELLRERISHWQWFGFKDPRTCRLLAFWQGVFDLVPISVRYIVCVRNPISVAKSLARRGPMAEQKSHYLWLQHMLPSLTETAGAPRVVTDYDLLMQQPQAQVRRIANRLGLEGRLDAALLADYATNFLDPNLRHNRQGPLEPRARPAVPTQLLEIDALLQQVCADAADIDAPASVELLAAGSQALVRMAPAFDYMADRDRRLIDAGRLQERTAAERDLALRHKAELIVEKDAYREQRDRARSERNLARHERGLARAQQGQAMLERQQALNQLTFVTAERDQLLASTSWRITAPLRRAVLAAARVRATGATIRLAVRDRGGLRQLPPMLWRILRQEGLGGLRMRVGFVRAMQSPDGLQGAPFVPRGRQRPELEPRRPVGPHGGDVDIVICVHNALDDVRRCLYSVVEHTTPPYRLIIVDDGSAEPTAAFLRDFMLGQRGKLIRHEQALGYTRAANRGMEATDAGFVCLLNSDTVVGEQWLDRMIACAESDASIGMVGPLSNTASWQSVPAIFDADGDWATNPLPDGVDPTRMCALVADVSPRNYPRVGFLNGFCLLLKRALLDALGLFDEDSFGAGFGEENDYCLRATAAGWQLAVADDAYIHHAQSRSYTHERRLALAEQADLRLRSKHAGEAIARGLLHTRDHPSLAATRARVAIADARARDRECIRRRHQGRRVLFLLPVAAPGGGANVVLSEALALARSGVDVEIANLRRFQGFFEAAYPGLALPTRYLEPPADLHLIAPRYDAVVATVFYSVAWLGAIASAATGTPPRLGYYAQDFEPLFFAATDPRHREAMRSYSATGVRVFTKTEWTGKTIREHTGAASTPIGPSLDLDHWFPGRVLPPGAPVTVSAMVRPSTPRRAPERTVAVLEELLRRRPERIRVEVFGVDVEDDALLRGLAAAPACTLHTVLRTDEMRDLLARSHLFLDLSDFQAMGLTCMEAMACGAAIVGPSRGGLPEVVADGRCGMLVDTEDTDQCVAAALRLIDDAPYRDDLVRNGLAAVARFWPEGPALRMMDLLFAS
jgi:GT2 family glycosyltransferase/glycosyltransferase involved in cell wall biosynthesis